MRKIISILITSLLTSLFDVTYAQNLPLGTPIIEEYIRRLQLTGKIDESISFTSRPINHAALPSIKNLFDPTEDLLIIG